MPETPIGPLDIHLFHEGTHLRLWEKLGSHPLGREGASGEPDEREEGARFAVWAPSAEEVSVVGDFNGWRPGADRLSRIDDSGLWEGIVPGAGRGALYRYHLHGPGEFRAERTDPFALLHHPGGEASVVWDLDPPWEDASWMASRAARSSPDAPISIYQLHPGSWRRVPEEGDRPLTYRELAPWLADHLERTGFTHVELVLRDAPGRAPLPETSGPFAPSGRHGTPGDLAYLIDFLHRRGRGVIVEWAPGSVSSRPPPGAGGGTAGLWDLHLFGGTPLFDPAGSSRSRPEAGLPFDLTRGEVRSFLLSSALFWLDAYHADGLRVEGLAGLLTSEGGRLTGGPGDRGAARDRPEGVELLRALNREAAGAGPGAITIASDPPGPRPLVSPSREGLGFSLAWDSTWTGETLGYLSRDPLQRKAHHEVLVARPLHAFRESAVLPLPHHGMDAPGGSLLQRMRGDEWQRFAHLRLLLGDLYAQPGKKLLFMGGEFAQWNPWDPARSLDWHLLDHPAHAGVLRWLGELNRMYFHEPALHELEGGPEGFEWIDRSDAERSTISFIRKGRTTGDLFLVVENFTPVPRENFRVGVPRGGTWREMLNGDGREYGGSGWGNLGAREAAPVPAHGRAQSLNIALPPLAVVFFKSEGRR